MDMKPWGAGPEQGKIKHMGLRYLKSLFHFIFSLCYCVLLCVIVCYCVLLCVIVCYCVLLCVIVCVIVCVLLCIGITTHLPLIFLF
jgi:hypothetical protein